MAIGVKVVYVDPAAPETGTSFVTRTAPLEADLKAVAALPRVGVLFIVISEKWGKREAMLDRLWSNYEQGWRGDDNYVIGTIRGTVKPYTDPVDLFFIEMYPDRENRMRVRALHDPQKLSRLAVDRPGRYPSEARTVTFQGAWIDSEIWHSVALPLFEKLY